MRAVVERTVRRAIRPCPRSIVWAGGGKVRELECRARLLDAGWSLFDFHPMVRVFFLHKKGGRRDLRMQRIGGDYVPGNVPRRQDVAQPGDLIGFAVHRDLAEDRAGALDHPGQEMDGARPRPVGRAPQAFAVEGQAAYALTYKRASR